MSLSCNTRCCHWQYLRSIPLLCLSPFACVAYSFCTSWCRAFLLNEYFLFARIKLTSVWMAFGFFMWLNRHKKCSVSGFLDSQKPKAGFSSFFWLAFAFICTVQPTIRTDFSKHFHKLPIDKQPSYGQTSKLKHLTSNWKVELKH